MSHTTSRGYLYFIIIQQPTRSTLFPYTTLFRSDQELGYVYLPIETPTNDFYGGHRPGNNLFAESLVCLDARTGKRVWHYQLDRKSTRLNSSHMSISYAVFCLKKKKRYKVIYDTI